MIKSMWKSAHYATIICIIYHLIIPLKRIFVKSKMLAKRHFTDVSVFIIAPADRWYVRAGSIGKDIRATVCGIAWLMPQKRYNLYIIWKNNIIRALLPAWKGKCKYYERMFAWLLHMQRKLQRKTAWQPYWKAPWGIEYKEGNSRCQRKGRRRKISRNIFDGG